MARLQDVGARATFYLTSGLIETRRAPWWDELAFALERTHESRSRSRSVADASTNRCTRAPSGCCALHAVRGRAASPPVERDQRLAAVRLRLGVSETAPCELANWDTATALVRSGMEVGAHTLTHPFLSVLPVEDQSREIEGSMELIEERLGVTPTGLAYPGGDHDARTVEAARVAGLAYAVTTRAGDNGAEASPLRAARAAGCPRARASGRRVSRTVSRSPSWTARSTACAARRPPRERRPLAHPLRRREFRRAAAPSVICSSCGDGIDRARFEVEIACFKREVSSSRDVEALGWPVHDLGLGRRIYDAGGCAASRASSACVRRFRPHVVHGYLFGPNLFAAMAGRLMGVPAVVVAKRNMDAFEKPGQVALQRVAHRLATHVTAVSEAVADTVVALGVPRDRITVIPNGVDASRFEGATADRARLGVNGDRVVVGSVGCLAVRKDYGTLLDALRADPRAGARSVGRTGRRRT